MHYLFFTRRWGEFTKEGQIWEMTMYAAGKNVDNLIATVDYNLKQIDGATDDVMPLGNLKDKFEAFGWSVLENKRGNNIKEVIRILEKAKSLTGNGKPIVILMHTEMGNGVNYDGDTQMAWISPNDDELNCASSKRRNSRRLLKSLFKDEQITQIPH